ncbi:histidine phosphatase family protein [Cytobacillus kochii]|uniref:Histidine phosphatase family protein n=1 Tax=Cytobacillus kochii TaxID=859143 RepID=A0A248TIY6_9BACI|nr:histidine phosphatase family protein [Cytobacillus kochii]ASV68178.1 histidine phosphatase family protein [Cytobacillus kochii]
MVKIYMTRHGQTEWNRERRLQGRLDSDLTTIGSENAKLLGEHLSTVPFDAIYASPSGRTMMTASLIKGNRPIKVFTDEDLQEIYMGSWEGQQQSDVQKQYADEFHAFWRAPHLYHPTERESFQQVQDRAVKVLKRVMTNHKNGNVLLVTHTVVIKTLLAYMKQIPMENLWDAPYIHDTCLSVIEIVNGQKNILLEADMSHLQPDQYEFT